MMNLLKVSILVFTVLVVSSDRCAQFDGFEVLAVLASGAGSQNQSREDEFVDILTVDKNLGVGMRCEADAAPMQEVPGIAPTQTEPVQVLHMANSTAVGVSSKHPRPHYFCAACNVVFAYCLNGGKSHKGAKPGCTYVGGAYLVSRVQEQEKPTVGEPRRQPVAPRVKRRNCLFCNVEFGYWKKDGTHTKSKSGCSLRKNFPLPQFGVSELEDIVRVSGEGSFQ